MTSVRSWKCSGAGELRRGVWPRKIEQGTNRLFTLLPFISLPCHMTPCVRLQGEQPFTCWSWASCWQIATWTSSGRAECHRAQVTLTALPRPAEPHAAPAQPPQQPADVSSLPTATPQGREECLARSLRRPHAEVACAARLASQDSVTSMKCSTHAAQRPYDTGAGLSDAHCA